MVLSVEINGGVEVLNVQWFDNGSNQVGSVDGYAKCHNAVNTEADDTVKMWEFVSGVMADLGDFDFLDSSIEEILAEVIVLHCVVF